MFWVISVYFNLRNILPKSGTFLLGHPVYVSYSSYHTMTTCYKQRYLAGLYNADTMYFEQLRTKSSKGKFVPIPATKANMGREGNGPLLLNVNTD